MTRAEEQRMYTVDEVAKLLRVSARWLADQCRAERIEHVHVARQRRFTGPQVDALIVMLTIRPIERSTADRTRERVMRLLDRKGTRGKSDSAGVKR